MKDLKRLLLDEAAEIYDAEKQLVKALPEIASAVGSLEVQSALDNHLGQTQEHVARLKRVFLIFGTKPRAKPSIAMTGLVAEALEWARKEADATVRDAALILALQKIEHYEIASYGGLRAWVNLLGKDEATVLLDKTGDEEKDMDNLLNEIASQINIELIGQGGRYEVSPTEYNRTKSLEPSTAGKSAGRTTRAATVKRHR